MAFAWAGFKAQGGPSASGATGDGAGPVMVEPVRAAWPTAPDSSGGWSTVGEVVIKNAGPTSIKIKRITCEFQTATGATIVKDLLPRTQFKKRFFVYSILGDGTVVPSGPGTSEVKPGEEGLALVSGLQAASAPSTAVIQVTLTGGTLLKTTVPVIDASGSLKMGFPLAIPDSPLIKGVSINTFATLYHRTAILPLPDGRHLCSQRYASDLLMANIKTKKPAPKGATAKEQHYAWDQLVLAAAEGIVVFAQDGNPDVELGQNDDAHPAGNHVVIEHAPGHYTLYAHLREGSVLVRPGDPVVRGQSLGRVGSSGASELPHLHFQAMDAWEGPDDITRLFYAQGLPALMDGVDLLRGKSLIPLTGAQLMERDIIAGPSATD
jgi:hypothetical protein